MATNKKRNNKKGHAVIKKMIMKTTMVYEEALKADMLGKEFKFAYAGKNRSGIVAVIEFDGVHTNIELKNVKVVR